MHESDRFVEYFRDFKTGVVYGGVPFTQDKEMPKKKRPQVLIGIAGRVLGLLQGKTPTF